MGENSKYSSNEPLCVWGFFRLYKKKESWWSGLSAQVFGNHCLCLILIVVLLWWLPATSVLQHLFFLDKPLRLYASLAVEAAYRKLNLGLWWEGVEQIPLMSVLGIRKDVTVDYTLWSLSWILNPDKCFKRIAKNPIVLVKVKAKPL